MTTTEPTLDDWCNQVAPRMRVAYTRACVNFPAVDVGHIKVEVALVFSAVLRAAGVEQSKIAEIVRPLVDSITEQATKELLNEDAVDRFAHGFAASKRPSVRKTCMGLEPGEMRTVHAMARKDYKLAMATRHLFLTTRRNRLANALARGIAEMALEVADA